MRHQLKVSPHNVASENRECAANLAVNLGCTTARKSRELFAVQQYFVKALRASIEVFFLMDGLHRDNGSCFCRFFLGHPPAPTYRQTTQRDSSAGNHSPPCDPAIHLVSHPCLPIIGPDCIPRHPSDL